MTTSLSIYGFKIKISQFLRLKKTTASLNYKNVSNFYFYSFHIVFVKIFPNLLSS